MYLCMYVCTYVRMYVCTYVYIYGIYVYPKVYQMRHISENINFSLDLSYAQRHLPNFQAQGIMVRQRKLWRDDTWRLLFFSPCEGIHWSMGPWAWTNWPPLTPSFWWVMSSLTELKRSEKKELWSFPGYRPFTSKKCLWLSFQYKQLRVRSLVNSFSSYRHLYPQ